MRLKSRTRRGNNTVVTFGTATTVGLAANNYREVAIFQNTGTATWYFGFGTGVGTANGLQLGTATTFILEQHVGPIYGCTSGGSTTIVMAELGESSTPGTSAVLGGVYSTDLTAGTATYPGTPAFGPGEPFLA
jgi:hypothetical protein